MGDWSIIPTKTGVLDIMVDGEFEPAAAIELGLSIIDTARKQALRNGTPKLTYEGARGAGT